MPEFKFSEVPVECHWCHSAVTESVITSGHDGSNNAAKDKMFTLCRFCYTTQAGNVMFYTSNYSEDVRTVVQTVLQVGNMLREEMLAQNRVAEAPPPDTPLIFTIEGTNDGSELLPGGGPESDGERP